MNSTMPRRCMVALFALLATFLLSSPAILHAQGAEPARVPVALESLRGQRPRLVVVISIDQFRDDYLRRLSDLFLRPATGRGKLGGFNYLMGFGATYLNAQYGHIPLFTGPGHAVILTGGYPCKTGIVSNNWVDRHTGRGVYCVDDTFPLVGSNDTKTRTGPLNLRSTTVGDELKLATGGRAKVVSLALKDRAAILLGGHMQDACIWFDNTSGRWISSRAYCRDGALPVWVTALNDEKIPDRTLGRPWELGLSAEGRARALPYPTTLPHDDDEFGATFPHMIARTKSRPYELFTLSPDANRFVLATALRAVQEEHLGADSIPDLLAINLSTNDYIGHAFGPYSLEAIDLTVRTDSAMAEFLTGLNSMIQGGIGNVVVVVTADHGVSPIPETLEAAGIRGGRVSDGGIAAVACGVLRNLGVPCDSTHTPSRFIEPYVYVTDEGMNAALRAGKARSRAEVEDSIAAAITNIPGIYACYTRTQIAHGALPPNDIARHIANGFHPILSGDVLVLTEPGYINGGAVTTHGTPYIYDTHVPLLMAGFGIPAGACVDPVSPADIAPTLCTILGIEFPSACDGVPLKRVLE